MGALFGDAFQDSEYFLPKFEIETIPGCRDASLPPGAECSWRIGGPRAASLLEDRSSLGIELVPG
jgi:hypothetical protein